MDPYVAGRDRRPPPPARHERSPDTLAPVDLPPMDYRDAFRHYERAGPIPIADDLLDRGRKRPRSPSPAHGAGPDHYAPGYDRRSRSRGRYPSPDPWEREYREREYRDRSPFGRERYDAYYRDRARDWDPRYDRETDRERWERERYAAGDAERYGPRMRLDEDRERAYGRYDREYDRYRDDPYADGRRPEHGRERNQPPPPPDPLQSTTLLPFKSYAQMIKAGHPSSRDRSLAQPTTAELYEGYQTYRLAFQKRSMTEFFEEKRNEPWFRERYGLAEQDVQKRSERKREGRQGKKQKWLQELRNGELDGVSFDMKAASKSLLQRMGLSSEAEPDSDSRRNGRDEDDEVAGPMELGDASPSKSRDVAEPSAPPKNGATNDSASKTMSTVTRNGTEEVQSDTVTIPADPLQILIKTFPPNLPREKLENVFRTQPGFRYLALGEPNPAKKMHRIGWAEFEEGTDMAAALEALDKQVIDDFTLHLGLSERPATSRLRTTPEYACTLVRLETDLKKARALVSTLEGEDLELFREKREAYVRDLEQRGAEVENEVWGWLDVNSSEAIEKRCAEIGLPLEEGGDVTAESEDSALARRKEIIKKHLDLHLDLLRTVYNCDYYSSVLCEYQEELLRKCPKHVRKVPAEKMENAREGTNDESWAKSLDHKSALLIDPNGVNIEEYGGKNVEKEMLDAAKQYVEEEEKEKHRCKVVVNEAECGKLFKASVFVEKHVLNKHRAFLENAAKKRIDDALYYNNYVRDPARVTPSFGQSTSLGGGVGGTPTSSRSLAFDSPGNMFNMGMHHPSMMSPMGGMSGSPLFGTPQMGLIRLGSSTLANGSPIAGGGGAGRHRRSPSPHGGVHGDGRRLSDRLGGMAPESMNMAMPMSMPMMGPGGGMMGAPSPLSGAGPGGSMALRLGGMVPSSMGAMGIGMGMGMGMGHHAMPPTPSSASPIVKPMAEPLPEPPKPLDPRARQQQKSYQDLDGPAAEGDVELQY